MGNHYKLSSALLFFILLFVSSNESFSQGKHKRAHQSLRDSLQEKIARRDSLIRSMKHYRNPLNMLGSKIQDYTLSYVEYNADLSRGFDTVTISTRLPVLERQVNIMRTAINNSTTLGNMVVIRGIIDHLNDETKKWDDKLIFVNGQLDKIHAGVARFKSDSTLRAVPEDTTLKKGITIQVKELNAKWQDIDSCVERSLIRIGLLQNRVTSLSVQLIDLNDRTDQRISDFAAKALTNEYGFLWDKQSFDKSGNPNKAVMETYHLNSRLYRYFLSGRSNYAGHFGGLFVLIAFLIWIYNSSRKIRRLDEGYQSIFDQTNYIVKHPYLSSLIIITVLWPYFYNHPPQVFAYTMALAMTACFGILIKSNWPPTLFRFWCYLLVAAIVFCFSNLLVLITYTDRIILLIASGVIGYQAIKLLILAKTSTEQYPPYLIPVLYGFIALQCLSVVLNLTGRFSLAEIVGITATLNICLAFGFYLFIQIIMESLFLQLETHKQIESNLISSYLDFKLLREKTRDILIKLTGILWLVALAKNLTIDDYLYDQVAEFLNHPYQVGSTAFTFRGIVVFVFIIWLSGLLAKVISYFYDFVGEKTRLTPHAKKTRSSILLIRLSIFVIGFFVAISAAGIPMDRVTIIIGALGVGIGFGLQNIVNNLVSGVILAVEKPIQVGDIIEVTGKSGTIKEIGIRSSKIECGDGSELIVPNGDLISQHVINWTLTNNNRRVELIIRVVYGSDVVLTENVLNSIIQSHGDIMKTPAPSVFLYNFSDSAIEFRAWFWAADISTWLQLKSSVMRAIYTEFANQGIEIPQGQKDIQVNFPENLKDTNSKETVKTNKAIPPEDQQRAEPK
jgi:potassium efflux system protein